MKEDLKEIYDKIYTESGFKNEIEKNKKWTKNVLISYGISFLIMPFNLFLGVICSILVFIYAVTMYSKYNGKNETKEEKEFNNMYKQKVIFPILQENFKEIQYFQNEGISLEEYLEAEYLDSSEIKVTDKFVSNDHIILPIFIENKHIGDLHIYDVSIERVNNDGRAFIYEGLIGSLVLSRKIGHKIKLCPNWLPFYKSLVNEEDIEVEKFEKYFKILSDDEILAMRIFTVDVMEQIIQLCNESNIIVEMNIINENLYIRARWNSNSAFEPETNDINEEEINRDIMIIKTIEKIAKMIYIIIDNIEE